MMRWMIKDKPRTKFVDACIDRTIRTRRECNNGMPALDEEEYVPPISNELKREGLCINEEILIINVGRSEEGREGRRCGKKGRCVRNSGAQRAATARCSGQLTVQG